MHEEETDISGSLAWYLWRLSKIVGGVHNVCSMSK